MDWQQELTDGIAERDVERVRLALSSGADPNFHEPDDGSSFDGVTPLFWAADSDPEIAQLLIVHGAVVSAERPTDGSTSLHEAAEAGNVECLRLLLQTDFGPHLATFDYVSRTPLHCAVRSGSLECARLLIEAGCDVNANDEPNVGDTALHDAVEAGNLPMVELLLDHGADPTIRGWMWRTPLDKAREGERDDRPRIREIVEAAARGERKPMFRHQSGHPRGKGHHG
jgi:ankyrin repeat protein